MSESARDELVRDQASAVRSPAGRPTPDLAIIETRVYRGANVWSYDKAIHLVVDLGGVTAAK